MITTTDAANILYKDSAIFGMPVFQDGNVPTGFVDEKGRVVIHSKEHSLHTIWKKGFLEVNLFVADTQHGNSDLIRLNELERMAIKSFHGTGEYDGTTYKYVVQSTRPLENKDLKAHYINVKVFFKAMNTME